jgi:hypothetical protein
MYLHRARWHSSATLTEVHPCFFLSCTANAGSNPQRWGMARTLPKFLCCSRYCFVLFCVLFMCKRVLYYGHRVATQLQLTNISYHISYHIMSYHIFRNVMPWNVAYSRYQKNARASIPEDHNFNIHCNRTSNLTCDSNVTYWPRCEC